MITDRGDLVTADAAGPLTHTPPPAGGALLVATFSDAEHGLLVSSVRPLQRTADGGATWLDVDLAGAAAFDVRALNDQLVAQTTAGPHLIGADGSVATPTAATMTPGLDTHVPAETVRRLTLDLLARRATVFSSSTIRRPDGTRLVQGEQRLLAADPASGRIVRSEPNTIPTGCNLASWGPVVGARWIGARRRRSTAVRTDLHTHPERVAVR